MGFVLTLVYVALALLSPVDRFPDLAVYRVELVVFVLALPFSLPGLLDRRFFRIPQIYLLAGLLVTVSASLMFGAHWLGGGLVGFFKFLPAAIVFYLVALNCQSIGRLKILGWLLVAIAGFYVLDGAAAYLSADTKSPLLEVIPGVDGTFSFRMRGLGFLKDPNELAQLLVMIIPILWIQWRPGRFYHNVLFVIVPTLFFAWGIYLTHSRGAVVALVVIMMFALKDRMRLIPTLLMGAWAFALLVALDFAGGREISFAEGSDRMALWSEGLELFKQSPIFGVGFESFADHAFGHTAHNTFVVCLAELGILGYTFWVALLVFTIASLTTLIAYLRNASPRAASRHYVDESESWIYYRWAHALRVSLVGFVAAAFFLSRAYALAFYLFVGMAAALCYVVSNSQQQARVAPQSFYRLAGLSAGVGFAAIAVVYVGLRLRSVIP